MATAPLPGDPGLLRLQASQEFPPGVVAAAEEAAGRLAGLLRGRPDLSFLEPIAIDDAETDEVDDAVALEAVAGGFRLHVFISDVAALIPREGELDREAARRATTIYHPVARILMLPERISCDCASLQPGELRLASDYCFHLDGNLSCYHQTIAPVAVRIGGRLTYDEADGLLGAPEGSELAGRLALVRRATEQMFNERVRQGAIHFFPMEYKVRVREGRVHLLPADNFSPARRLVAELMIACGAAAGRMLGEQLVPAIYRRQSAPQEPIEWDEESARNPVFIFDSVRRLKRAENSLRPEPHAALGVAAYTQVTSPLRRYGDLLMQRQLATFLVRRVPEYSEGELLRRMNESERVARLVRKVVLEANRHWTIEALAARTGEKVRALVIDDVRSPVLVLLPDFALNCRFAPRRPCHAGEELTLRVVKADGKSDTVVLGE